MPKDDYAKARSKEVGRRERARLEFEKRVEERTKAFNFPPHILHEQPDGTYISDLYTFDVSRWS